MIRLPLCGGAAVAVQDLVRFTLSPGESHYSPGLASTERAHAPCLVPRMGSLYARFCRLGSVPLPTRTLSNIGSMT